MRNQIILKIKVIPDSVLLVAKLTLEMIFDSADVDSFVDTADLNFKAAVH